MTKYRGFAIRIQINIHKKGAVACNYSMEWNAQNSKFHQCECGFSTDHSRYNKHLFLWLFSIPVFLISFFYVNIGEKSLNRWQQFSMNRGLFWYFKRILWWNRIEKWLQKIHFNRRMVSHKKWERRPNKSFDWLQL